MDQNEEKRNTGRTTGIMLSTIAEAVLNDGTAVQFIDHACYGGRATSMHHAAEIERMVLALGLLDISVGVTRHGRVFVQSDFKTKKRKINEPA